MAEQDLFIRKEHWVIRRAVVIPVVALLVALFLIYTRSPTGDSCSPRSIGGEDFCWALRSIAIRLGLSSFLGGLIGIASGALILRSSKLAAASLRFLRIAQWVPFILWWPLAPMLLLSPGEQMGRYFVVWTICIPAVALGTCYHFLCTRFIPGLERPQAISELARVAILQALFISLMLVLSVRPELWAVYPGNKSVTRHYAAFLALAVFLLVVKWVYRSNFDHTAGLRRQIFFAELNGTDRGSLWHAIVIVLLCLIAWQLLSISEYLRASPVGVFKNVWFLLTPRADIWKDMGVSLLEILTGLVLSGVLAVIVSETLLTNATLKRWVMPIVTLTFVVPILALVPWHGWLIHTSQSSSFSSQSFGFYRWTAACVVCLSFFPFMQALWGLRDQPLLCRILVAADNAIPYGFTAMIYGEMMSAIAGLGFAVVIAGATHQIEKAFAVFLLTLFLLTGVSFILRWVVKTIYFPEGSAHKIPASAI